MKDQKKPIKGKQYVINRSYPSVTNNMVPHNIPRGSLVTVAAVVSDAIDEQGEDWHFCVVTHTDPDGVVSDAIVGFPFLLEREYKVTYTAFSRVSMLKDLTVEDIAGEERGFIDAEEKAKVLALNVGELVELSPKLTVERTQ